MIRLVNKLGYFKLILPIWSKLGVRKSFFKLKIKSCQG